MKPEELARAALNTETAEEVESRMVPADLERRFADAIAQAVAAERARCLAAVEAVEADGLSFSPDGWQFYGEYACYQIAERIKGGS